jgi:hypothetical protein
MNSAGASGARLGGPEWGIARAVADILEVAGETAEEAGVPATVTERSYQPTLFSSSHRWRSRARRDVQMLLGRGGDGTARPRPSGQGDHRAARLGWAAPCRGGGTRCPRLRSGFWSAPRPRPRRPRGRRGLTGRACQIVAAYPAAHRAEVQGDAREANEIGLVTPAGSSRIWTPEFQGVVTSR